MMTKSVSGRRRVLGVASFLMLGAAGVLATGWAPASAQTAPVTTTCPAPVLSLGNPNPGDLLPQGGYVISGTAYDSGATDGTSGVARVDLFLGSRDAGGEFLGSAVPGANDAFQLEATMPTNINGGRNFVAYAYSAVNTAMTTVSVPVYIGASATPTPTTLGVPPIPLSETTTSTCGSAPMDVAAPTTAPTVVTAPQSLPGLAQSSAPVLSLANPNPGDLLPYGDMYLQGVAYDPNAPAGSDGVDSVEVFLESRDSGGLLLGQGVPASDHTFSIKSTIPSGISGTHTLFAYAHSSVTGQEIVVSVSPVNVGVAPSPTPRPVS